MSKAGMVMRFDRNTYDRVMKSKRSIIATAEWVEIKCKFCESKNIYHHGRDRKGKQRFLCNDCGRTFIDNKAPPRMRFPTEAIALALNMFYESASLAKIQRQIELSYGLRPDRMSIYRWIIKYSNKAVKELSNIPIKVGSTWIADETVLKTKQETRGAKQWFWDIIDDKTRFLLASHLSETRGTKDAQTIMEKASQRANKIPEIVVTDKLKSYLDRVELVFGADTKHLPVKKLTSKDGTQLIEQFRSTLKERTKVMRSFLRRGTARKILDGWLIHYNFFRPHFALKGKTPASSAGVVSPFKNWADVIKG